MKGVINKGIQELVESQFGSEAWSEIKIRAGCDEPFFATSEDYPDEMSLSLVQAASEVSGLAVEDVLVEFGKYWVPNTGAKSYPAFYKMAGTDARRFLLNMNRIHDQVTHNLANATPPRFTYEELDDGRLLMHYHTERNLCPVLRGLILGVGIYFNEDLTVNETACTADGAPHCTMEVSFS